MYSMYIKYVGIISILDTSLRQNSVLHGSVHRRELVLSSQASWLAEAEWHEEQHPGGFYRIYPRGDDCKYSKFLDQGSSYCQETVTSRAREEYAR